VRRHRAWLGWSLAVAGVVVGPGSAAAEDLAPVSAPTAISAWGGHVVWSAYDPATSRYRLADRSQAGVRMLPVAARSIPFDADVGPGRDGRPVVVYSRCRVEGEPFVRPGWWGTFRHGRGCDIFALRLGGARERLVRGRVSTTTASETTPSIWRGRIAFARRDERGRGLRRRVPRLYVQARAGSRRLLPLARGTIPCDPRHPSPPAPELGPSCAQVEATTLAVDLRGRFLAFGWRYRGGNSSGVGDVTEIRLTRLGSRSSGLLASKDAGGSASNECSLTPLWPSLGRTTVSWLVSSGPDDCPQPVSAVIRRDLTRPRVQRAQLPGAHLALAFDGPTAFAIQARGARPYDPFRGVPPRSCNEPERSCELVTLALPPFSPAP
jgi:hypothetical protein